MGSRGWCALAMSLAACGFDSKGAGTADGPGIGEDSSGTTTTGAASGMLDPSDSGNRTESMSGSMSGSSPGTTRGPTGTTPGTTDPSTTGGADETIGGDPTTSGASSEGPKPDEEHLINGLQGECGNTLWCNDDFQGGGIGAMRIQECFAATLEPPFQLQEVSYVVAAANANLDDFVLQVREWDSGPGSLLGTAVLDAGQFGSVGPHTITLLTPFELDAPRFCVGFATQPGPAGGLGIGQDPGEVIAETSYIRVDISGDCSVPTFTEISAFGQGNWCIDARISL